MAAENRGVKKPQSSTFYHIVVYTVWIAAAVASGGGGSGSRSCDPDTGRAAGSVPTWRPLPRPPVAMATGRAPRGVTGGARGGARLVPFPRAAINSPCPLIGCGGKMVAPRDSSI